MDIAAPPRLTYPSAKANSFDSTDSHSSLQPVLATPELVSTSILTDNLDNASLRALVSSGDWNAATGMTTTATSSEARLKSSISNDSSLHQNGSWRSQHHRSSGTSNNPTLESAQSSLDHSSSLESSLQSDSASTESGLRPVHSSTTGCYISAPMSPPVGYPMPQAGHPIAGPAPLKPPVAPAIAAATEQAPERLSVISSSSSGSSRSNKSGSANVAAPGWAQPPSKNRAMSLESGIPAHYTTDVEPNVNPVQTVEGSSGEPIEVLKGEQGRIAIKSTPTQYEVLVWLPGFSINDITIVSRRHQVLHIVADQWDENDHAQWEIKLGDDAIMNSIRAAFTGQELRITVSRNVRQQFGNHSNTSNVSMRTASTRAAPAMSGAAIAHTHERSMSSPSTGWGALERRELEASSQSFREAR